MIAAVGIDTLGMLLQPLLSFIGITITHTITISGGDLSNLLTTSALACASACDGNTQCLGWVWDASGTKKCYLKKTVNARTTNSSRVAGVKQGVVGTDRAGNVLPGRIRIR